MSATYRIEPVERPDGIRTRIAYWLIRRKLGKVITPAKIIYARYPSLFTWVKKMGDFQEKEIPLDAGLKLLVKQYVAWLNGCAFCQDLGESLAGSEGHDLQKMRELGSFRENPIFSDLERTALEFAEQANNKSVTDELFGRMKQYFDDRQIIGIAYIVATENYYNIMNGALGIGSDGLCSIRS